MTAREDKTVDEQHIGEPEKVRGELEKWSDYSIDLQRIIEDLCDGRTIRKPKTTARHHYEIAVAVTDRRKRLPQDVVDLVIAARIVAYEDQSAEAIRTLDIAVEAFSSRVPWENEPDATPESTEGVTPQWPDNICAGNIRYGRANNYDGFYLADAQHGIPTFGSVAETSPATIRGQHVRIFNYPEQTEAIAAEIVRRWNSYPSRRQLVEALREISRQYENQNINHVDFRVGAKQIADAALAQEPKP